MSSPTPLSSAPPTPTSRRFPRLPFRNQSRRNRIVTENGEAIGILVIQVLEARNLKSSDKNGLSDPFVQLTFGTKRVSSEVVYKTLNPIFKDGNLQIPFNPDAVELNALLEVVVWDKDMLRKEYLGELSIRTDSFFPCLPFIEITDPRNIPQWYPLRSTKSRVKGVEGELKVKIGFAPLPSSQQSTLTPQQLERILSALQDLSDRTEGKPRNSKEEILFDLTSPTDSFGTSMIHDVTPLGILPSINVSGVDLDLTYASESSSSDSEGEFEGKVEVGVDDDGSETETDSDSESESETEGENFDADLDLPSDALPSPPPILVTSVTPTETLIPLPPPPSPPSTILAEQSSSTTSSSPVPPSISGSTESTPSKLSQRSKGLSLPKFMKRIPSSSSFGKSRSNALDSDIAGGSSSEVPDSSSSTGGKEKKKTRFSRKKKSVSTSLDSEGNPVLKEEKKVKRRKSKKSKRPIEAAMVAASLPSISGSPSTTPAKLPRKKLLNSGLGRKKSRNYQYNSSETSYGLVQIEIKSASNLPVWSNTLRTTFDMDPFVVISFGRKVFRTRVIRHSLNPEWNEKLFFHVTRTEEKFLLNFDVLDWDITTSNDNVGSVSVSLADLFDGEVGVRKDDVTGVYETKDGKLVGDDFVDRRLKIATVGDKSAELHIRAKFTPYTALRQNFFRQYLKQYDIDDSGNYSHVEVYSMLDSLGSTLTKETITTFFTRFGKSIDQELSAEQVIICLEDELRKSAEEKRPLSASNFNNSGTATPSILHSYSPSPHSGSRPTTPSPLVNNSTGYFTPHLGSESEVESLIEKLQTNDEVTIVLPNSDANEAPPLPSPSIGADLRRSESIEGTPGVERVINIKSCPLCHKPRMSDRAEVDLITHIAICASEPGSINRIVVGSFVTAPDAQRKFFSRAIAQVTKGSYRLGANSANIIVQERKTGALQEEKMAVYVRLGMRLAYKGFGAGGAMEGARIRKLLESMSIKQGIKFDSPNSVSEIAPFVKFHNLNLTEILDPLPSFKNFNEFFYRKLKPEARPVEDIDDPNTLVSPADCRAMFFETITDATRFWIKGNSFSIAKLLGDSFKSKASVYEGGSMGIFRLAPQDYHRFHSPVDGVCQEYVKIPGRYYTVNPQGVRSAIDIFGENVRGIQPIISPIFGETMHIWVGAMMVGSINMTKKERDHVRRGEELGYFSFGGSTIIVLFPPGVITFDEDLLANSRNSMETLVTMGSRVGRRTGA